MDYVAWARRAKTFLRRLARLPGTVQLTDYVDPPGRDDNLYRDWLASENCSLPAEVRNFVSNASSRCTFFYRWSIPTQWKQRFNELIGADGYAEGGGDLCDAAGFSLYDRRGPHRTISGREVPDRAGLLPIFRFLGDRDNEAALALDLTEARRGVVFLGQREGQHKLSSDLDAFLTNWELICYRTPRPSHLKPWLDPRTGLLEPDVERARQLRTLFEAAASEPL